MTPVEEQQAFYAAIGRAITQWANVEFALLKTFLSSVDSGDPNACAAGVYALESFRAKLEMTDKALSIRYRDSDLLREWIKPRGFKHRLNAQSRVRNWLAHFTVVVFAHGPSGRRYNLRPNIFNPTNPKLHQRIPQGGYFLGDLLAIPKGFFHLTCGLENYAARLCGQPEPMPKTFETEEPNGSHTA
jgi:hypothetical protein